MNHCANAIRSCMLAALLASAYGGCPSAPAVEETPESALPDSSTASYSRTRSITTRLTYAWNSDGYMEVTFIATRDASDPVWHVSADFVPRGITVQCESFGCAPGVWDLKGRARGETIHGDGSASEIVAEGCYWKARNSGARIPATAYCTFLIDSDGVASISNLTFSYPFP